MCRRVEAKLELVVRDGLAELVEFELLSDFYDSDQIFRKRESVSKTRAGATVVLPQYQATSWGCSARN
jgi:hypothetical protein